METIEWVYALVAIAAIIAAPIGEILSRRRDPDVVELNKRIDNFYDVANDILAKVGDLRERMASVERTLEITVEDHDSKDHGETTVAGFGGETCTDEDQD